MLLTCDSGYQLWFTGLGASTPCYSVPSTILVPESTPANTANWGLITQTVFARHFDLVAPTDNSGLPTSHLIGIIAGSILGPLLIINIVVIFLLRRRKARRQAEAEANRVTTFPPIEPTMPPTEAPQTPHELASPDMGARSPRSPQMGQLKWSLLGPGSSPPAYDSQRSLGFMAATKLKIPQDPQELEGSTSLNQHHPAFAGDEGSISPTAVTASSPQTERPKTPKTPVRSLHSSDRGSPLVTPSSGIEFPSTRSPPVVSPPGSPRQVPGRLG
jgi:hypothetical protein